MLKKIALIHLFSLLFFMAVGFACDRSVISFAGLKMGVGAREEEKRIGETLKAYNAIVQDFYASGGVPAKLNDFPAVKPVRHELFRDIGFLSDNRRIMVYDAAEHTPMGVELTAPGKAEAVLFEEWNYIYQRAKDRRPISTVKGMVQGVKYKLEKVKGAWMVVEWEPFDVKEPDKKDEFYF